MSGWHLAQLNIAHMQAEEGSDLMADFFDNFDKINGLAESAPGFVWRLIDSENPDIPNHGFEPHYIVNLSVWDSIESLHNFVYRTEHKDFLRRKSEWFHRMPRAHMVLWWISADQIPTAAQAKNKLEHLQLNGPTEQAFTFRQAFAKPA